jgi:uncharacterized membrane protein YphA (DoxX/SURF4 family)
MTTPPSPSRAFETSPTVRPPGRFARIATVVVRLLLGLPLVVFGLNGFLNFIPPPPTPLAEGAAAFSKALIDTGYMMPLIGATQMLVGVLLVLNRFVPLALVLFAPFIVNAVAFHLALEHSGLVPSLVFLALHLFLAWRYRAAYASLLRASVSSG